MNQIIEIKDLEFPPGNVPMSIVAMVYERGEEQVRNLIDEGIINIGHVQRHKRRGKQPYRRTYVSPLKLYLDTGFRWRGEQTVEEIKSRYS